MIVNDSGPMRLGGRAISDSSIVALPDGFASFNSIGRPMAGTGCVSLSFAKVAIG